MSGATNCPCHKLAWWGQPREPHKHVNFKQSRQSAVTPPSTSIPASAEQQHILLCEPLPLNPATSS
eukprot:4358909-Heterocapsa_arctica.AAC.1